MTEFYSHGKLLLTGEYLVLDGAKALALPAKYGQTLKVSNNESGIITWQSLDFNGNVWFETSLSFSSIHNATLDHISQRLLHIFKTIKELHPQLFDQGYSFVSTLEFPADWGLGSSSTLINNLASWANIDPYLLLEKTFGGSGYDIACAQYNSPITYQLHKGKRLIEPIEFRPKFSKHLYFIHLNQKQDSREGIANYRSKKENISSALIDINSITNSIITCNDLEDFNFLIEKHELIISRIIEQEPVKKRLFNDFNGGIKSLGAWGGDFILVSSLSNPIAYFKGKGYNTIIPFKDMIL